MDYLLRYTDLPVSHILIALFLVVIFTGIFRNWRGLCIGLLAGWLFLTLSSTVLSRFPFVGQHLELHLFWSYRAHSKELLKENFLNVFLLMPVGVLLPCLRVGFGRTALFGSLWSLMIETLQLITQRGLFELDDIFHNTVGVVIGYLIYLLLRRIVKKIRAPHINLGRNSPQRAELHIRRH